MVVERSDVKRRRRDAQEPLGGSPKRTKVHAQRKFAQGSGVTLSPMSMTPIKEKSAMMVGGMGGVKMNGVGGPLPSSQQELATDQQLTPTPSSSSHELMMTDHLPSAQGTNPANRPNTEDFLTFLCFRGTKVLPSRLNFFNMAYKSEDPELQESTSVSPGTSKQSAANPLNQENAAKPKKSSGQLSCAGVQGNGGGSTSGARQRMKQQSLAAVQALKDKYRRQRLSQRQKVTLTKLARKVKGKNMVRTRSVVLLEERKKKKKYPSTDLGIQVAASSVQPSKARPQSHAVIFKRLGVNRVRAGLRSSGKLPPGSDVGIKTDRKQRKEAASPATVTKALQKPTSRAILTAGGKLKKVIPIVSSAASEVSSVDSDEPLAKKLRSTRTRRPPPVPLRPTTLVSSVKKRPSRKTKEAATIYMEMLTKDLRSPDEEDEEEEERDVEALAETANTKEGQKNSRDNESLASTESQDPEPVVSKNEELRGERELKAKAGKQQKAKSIAVSASTVPPLKSKKDSSQTEKKLFKGHEKPQQDGPRGETKAKISCVKTTPENVKAAAGSKKYLEVGKEDDKSLTETSTRATRKSITKVKETAASSSPPPQRVLRAKRNRINLAEDRSSDEDEEEDPVDEDEEKEPTYKLPPSRSDRSKVALKSPSSLKTRRSLKGRVSELETTEEGPITPDEVKGKIRQRFVKKLNDKPFENEVEKDKKLKKLAKKAGGKQAELKKPRKSEKKASEDSKEVLENEEEEEPSKKSWRTSRPRRKSEHPKVEEEIVEMEPSKVSTRRHTRHTSLDNSEEVTPPPKTAEPKKRLSTSKRKNDIEDKLEKGVEEQPVKNESEKENPTPLVNNNNNEESRSGDKISIHQPKEEESEGKKENQSKSKMSDIRMGVTEGKKEEKAEIKLEIATPVSKLKTCDLESGRSIKPDPGVIREDIEHKVEVMMPKQELSVDVSEKKVSRGLFEMNPHPEVMQQPVVSKPSIGDTWREAFKNAKLPKPGQLSPIPHGVRPFERKPFSKSPLSKETGESLSPKVSLPTVFPVKRLLTKEGVEGVFDEKKVVVKSLTQLQYEKRTSELVSGLVLASESWQPEAKKPAVTPSPAPTPTPVTVKPSEGKHLNLPLPVEHTLRKHSPTTVTRKPTQARVFQPPPPSQPQLQPSVAFSTSLLPQEVQKKMDEQDKPSAIVDLNLKKKVNMTTEEIKGWLSDSTSSGIKHAKNCEIFKNNRCECSYRTRSGGSLTGGTNQGSPAPLPSAPLPPSITAPSIPLPILPEVDKSVVQPPVQLKELDPKFCTETISTCKVNLETEAVLECSTQTEREGDDGEGGGHLFYIPLPEGPINSQLATDPQQLIQGVAVKLDTEGPDQRVIMRAKLVTKPPTTFSSTPRSVVTGGKTKPEQKVRPLGRAALSNAASTVPSATTAVPVRPPPVVGTVQPTVRRSTGATVDQSTGTVTADRQTSQATQADSPSPKPARREPPQVALPLPPQPPSGKPSKSRQSGTESSGRGKLSSSNTLVAVDSPNFPKRGSTPCLVEAPTFRPTEKEFHDPLEYIDRITPLAQQFGICRIIPPPNFKPECKVSDDMRFTAYNQYIHKMLNRWGPNVKEMSAIRKYLATQSIALNQPPLIGGMEVDLPRLYQTVQQCGGLKEVIEKKRWTRVADAMKIPKSAQDRVTKLDDIYCKFLLPYDTLSHEERNKLLKEVEEEWRERERKEAAAAAAMDDATTEASEDDERDDRDECITKGKSMPLSAFFRVARNTMATWFKPDATPSAVEVESEFWRHVSTGQSHVCVHSASIESGTWGYGFPTAKSSSTSRHPWNLKVLTNNTGSILRSIGPLMGVTVPTLHVGMLFSTCCWYRDPHALPWIEYLHTGATKVWYGVPDEWSEELRGALKGLLPRYVRDKAVWLASDTAMVPPALLVDRRVSLCRTVQEPGQFVLVFPKAFTSSICTGYVVSESVYYAQPSWLDTAEKVFKDIQESCEPTVFSLEKLLFCIANDTRSSVDVLNQVLPMVVNIREVEVRMRRELEGVGLVATERLPGVTKGRASSRPTNQHDYDCDTCRGTLFLSLVANSHEEVNYCLTHAVEMLKKDPSQLKYCKLLYGYDEEEMEELIEKVKSRIETKSQKKGGWGKSGGASAAKNN